MMIFYHGYPLSKQGSKNLGVICKLFISAIADGWVDKVPLCGNNHNIFNGSASYYFFKILDHADSTISYSSLGDIVHINNTNELPLDLTSE